MNPREDRTALRLQLYNGGFEPLANRNKMCLIKGWSTFEVTPALIQSKEWARSNRNLDTGVRCGNVVALDWDIDDKALLNTLLDEVVGKGFVEETPFVRIGKAPRELWVYRTRDKIGKRTTGHFALPGAPADESGFAVEILGAGCQFAAYGQRDEKTEYQWPEQSLLDFKFMDLPLISKAQVDALKAFCEEFLRRNGLERRSPAGGTDAGYTHAYDLTDDLVFDVKDLGEMSVAELTEVLHANPEDTLRVTVEALRPTSGSWAGMASLVGDDLCISDHGTYTSHFPVSADLAGEAHKLGQLLAARFPQPEPPPPEVRLPHVKAHFDSHEPLDVNLRMALEHFAYSNRNNLIYDLDDIGNSMTFDHFCNRMRPYYREEAGPRGGRVVTRLADLWMQHPDRIEITGVMMRPDQPEFFSEDTGLFLNLYRPAVLPTEGGDATLGFEMLKHLLPVESERLWFTQWLAFKLRNPGVRGPGVIMVAHETYGTGRGSLGQMIRSMFAPGMVRTVDFKTLSGQTYQAQYNEWLADSLMVIVNEAQETAPQQSKYQTRVNTYEHLKDIVDPASHEIHVNRKGSSNTEGWTCASVLVFTNHFDSIVVPGNDRRLAVLENGKPMPPEYWEAFHAWRNKRENIGAFVRALGLVSLEGYNPYVAPPMTASKTEMVDAGTSELDRVLADALAGLTDTIVCREQVLLRMEIAAQESDTDLPDEWRRMAERMFQKRTRRLPSSLPDRAKIDGRLRSVRMIGRPAPEILQSVEKVVEEVLRNGPLQRLVKTNLTNIVSFPARG